MDGWTVSNSAVMSGTWLRHLWRGSAGQAERNLTHCQVRQLYVMDISRSGWNALCFVFFSAILFPLIGDRLELNGPAETILHFGVYYQFVIF